jgi:hypothetical protein
MNGKRQEEEECEMANGKWELSGNYSRSPQITDQKA